MFLRAAYSSSCISYHNHTINSHAHFHQDALICFSTFLSGASMWLSRCVHCTQSLSPLSLRSHRRYAWIMYMHLVISLCLVPFKFAMHIFLRRCVGARCKGSLQPAPPPFLIQLSSQSHFSSLFLASDLLYLQLHKFPFYIWRMHKTNIT